MSDVVFRVTREFDVIKIRQSKAVQERVARLVAAGKCLACECELAQAKKVVSGCCSSCAQAQYYAIRKHRTSLIELIKNGERLPAQPPGRKPNEYAARLLGRSSR